jgi:acyl-coenzyme A thioesterase PaaI-like protein
MLNCIEELGWSESRCAAQSDWSKGVSGEMRNHHGHDPGVCGQAIMAAADSVASLAIGTTERISKGTVYQHTHFLRPGVNDDFHVRAEVLRFGKASAFTETCVSFAYTGKLVAHASLEFAF